MIKRFHVLYVGQIDLDNVGLQGTPANDSNHRSVTEVLCKAGLTREATTLATRLGKGTTHTTLGTPAPPGSAGFDCVVLVGAQGVS